MVGLHKSTAAGIINTLKAEHFLEQNERTGKLRLGLDLFTLAVNARLELNDICEPYLNALLELTGETVNLAVLDKTEIVYIAKKESAHSIRISTDVGTRMPVYCTAIGKSILAAMDPAEAENLIDSLDMSSFTERTVIDRMSLISALGIIRREGIAYDFEELEYGLICIAAPLYYRKGNPVGAISVSGPSVRMDSRARAGISEHLLRITDQVCRELSRLS